MPTSLADLNNSLDNAGFGACVGGKNIDQILEARAVSNPRPRIDLPVLNQPDDAREIPRQGVARAEQRPLRLLEDHVAELDFVRRDADENEPASMSNEPESARH